MLGVEFGLLAVEERRLRELRRTFMLVTTGLLRLGVRYRVPSTRSSDLYRTLRIRSGRTTEAVESIAEYAVHFTPSEQIDPIRR